MCKRVITLITVIALLNGLFFCSSPKTVFKEEIRGLEYDILSVETDQGRIEFDSQGGEYVPNADLIRGLTKDGQAVEVGLDSIRIVHTRRSGVGAARDEITTAGTFKKYYRTPPHEKIQAVVLNDGREVVFDHGGGRIDRQLNTVSGISSGHIPVEVSFDDILYVKVVRADIAKTMLAAAGITALTIITLGIIVALTKESCPFFYSFDGDRYVMDAEPLGGAVCRGLERADWSRLDHLQSIDGEYRLMVRNEVDETQYLDQVRLLVFDHALDETIVSDTSGRFHVVKNEVLPRAARDENGRDLLPFLSASDGVAWRSRMPEDASSLEFDLRHQLTVTFPRPESATTARLVCNVGSTLWGSNMIREMLALRGAAVEDWYRAINSGGEAVYAMNNWMAREATWLVSLDVWEEGLWISHGYLPGAGPLVIEDRVCEMDLSSVTGDSLTIRLEPAFSFWNIDFLAMEYDSYSEPEYVEIPLSYAEDMRETDITATLMERDSDYYVMPEIGCQALMTFDAPPFAEDMKRTVFLQSAGYYRIHMPEEFAGDGDMLARIGTTPGEVVKYSVARYLAWLEQLRGH